MQDKSPSDKVTRSSKQASATKLRFALDKILKTGHDHTYREQLAKTSLSIWHGLGRSGLLMK